MKRDGGVLTRAFDMPALHTHAVWCCDMLLVVVCACSLHSLFTGLLARPLDLFLTPVLLFALSLSSHYTLHHQHTTSTTKTHTYHNTTAFNLEYYTQVQDLTYLIASMGAEGGGGGFSQRFKKLSQGLADVVEGYGLVGFTPLAIQVPGSMVVM